ncbi:MAG: ribonuclease E [Paracoccaceae bacterium]|jgi:ribonuclease E
MCKDNMAKKMLIDATHAEETRVVVADGNKVEEFDFESLNRRQLAGNIYLAKVTRVEPSLQAAFIDYGGNRHGFLAFSEIHPDYYQIPTADREALMAEEAAYAKAQADADAESEAKPKRRSSRGRSRKPADTIAADAANDAVISAVVPSGMDIVDLDEPDGQSDQAALGEITQVSGETEAFIEDMPDTDIVVIDVVEIDTDDADEIIAEEDIISTVAGDDDHEDIRPYRKPRARRYKIQEVVKVRQILLVQVVKEERGNKGAALTTYLSLAGRYCVLMPNTARGGGISRKITNAVDRKKLKEIATSIDVPQGAGLIVRTAGSQRTKAEIKRDYEYLQRQWEQVRALTLKSIAPAPIYEEGNLIHRSIRDLYNREIDEVLVEGEAGYRQAKDFMKMIMPSHAKNVKHYTDPMPLFARQQVEGYLANMFNPVVQLRSGGYIVIGITEALVAIDVNSGRATKEGSIEETATKTNLEAAEEVARQVRLRDLAGLIVIDFIDMDERRNNIAVEKRIKDKLKTDRARIQVGRISGFGLMEMSRQRLRPGMLEATTQECHHCHGTGLIRSDDNLALSILRQLEEEGTHRRSGEVLLIAPVGIVNFIMNEKREYLAAIEARFGMSVRIEADPHMVPPDYKIEKFKTATRRVVAAAPIVSMDSALMDAILEEAEAEAADVDVDDVVETDVAAPAVAANATSDTLADGTKKKRRRRRGGRGRRRTENGENGEASVAEDGVEAAPTVSDDAATQEATTEVPAETTEAPAEMSEDLPVVADAEQEPKPKSKPKPRSRGGQGRKKPVANTEVAEAEAPVADAVRQAVSDASVKMMPAAEPVVAVVAEPSLEPVVEAVAELLVEAIVEPAAEPQPAPDLVPEPEAAAVVAEVESKPGSKRKGWWSLG